MKTNAGNLSKGSICGIGLRGFQFMTTAFLLSHKKTRSTSVKKTEDIRIGFIGVGSRGRSHIHDTMAIDGIQIAAICDIRQNAVDQALKQITATGRKAPKVFTGDEHGFEKMLRNEKLDAVIIATPWEWHVPMAVASMKSGTAYTAVEVSAANTLEDAGLVNVHEETKQLMILKMFILPMLWLY
jgi:predicted dehydrogenase